MLHDLALFLSVPAALFSLAAVLGLLVGSFLNVVIYRVPLMMQQEWRREAALLHDDDAELKELEKAPAFNLVSPGSSCPSCQAPIRAWQNIPIISFLLQKGRCASCSIKISVRYPLVELATALLSLLIVWKFGASSASAFALLLIWTLIALTMIDVDHQLLPDSLTLPLLWLGLIANMSNIFIDLHSAVLGAIAGYLSLWSVYWLFKLATGKEGMGYGDFKLLAALGAWLGWQLLPLIIILSSLVGALLGSISLLLSANKQSTPIPFGPYLAIAGLIALLWGNEIVAAYLSYTSPV